MQTYYNQTKVNEVLTEGYDFQPKLLPARKPVVKSKETKLNHRNAVKAAKKAYSLVGHNKLSAQAVIKRVHHPKYRLNCQVSNI